jgi:hypothetical protein
MSRNAYLPEHYRIERVNIGAAADTLDELYQKGWRVIGMTAHPDGNQALCLLEKVA